MADGITVDILGNKAILGNLEAWGAEVQAEAQRKLEDAGQMALEIDNGLTPVRTGYLLSRNQLDVQESVVTVSNDADFAIFVALGHHTRSGSFVPPNDFLTPGMNEAGVWLLDELRKL